MSDQLHIALVQSDLYWNDPLANKNHFDALLKSLQDADLIVLPEMFTTGFCMQGIAETMDGATLQWMLHKAKSLNAAVCGSLIIQENNKQYNRFVWVAPDGEIEYYDKRHLFSLLGEEEQFAAGVERKLIHYKGWKIYPQICYDLRFPVYSRNDLGYDVLLYVANWPARRIIAWDKLLQARAIENQSYVVGVNRAGEDVNNIYFPGHSAVYDVLGETLVFLAEEEKVQLVTIDKEVLKETRERLPFLKDRDGFTISS